MHDNTRLAISIVIGALIIAGAIFLTSKSPASSAERGGGAGDINIDVPEDTQNKIKEAIRPIDNTDHYRGPQDAKIIIVEYSDFECPFCKRFHNTMNQIVDEYNEVAWVYRHFPLDVLHPKNARKVALASECAASLAGKDAFWRFADKFFEFSPANDMTNLDKVLPKAAKYAGVDYSALKACIDSGKFDKKIQDDLQNAQDTGGQGTPWNIIITKDGRYLPLSGAMPYETMKKIIDKILQSIK